MLILWNCCFCVFLRLEGLVWRIAVYCFDMVNLNTEPIPIQSVTVGFSALRTLNLMVEGGGPYQMIHYAIPSCHDCLFLDNKSEWTGLTPIGPQVWNSGKYESAPLPAHLNTSLLVINPEPEPLGHLTCREMCISINFNNVVWICG